MEVEVEEEEDDNGNSKEEGLGVAFCLKSLDTVRHLLLLPVLLPVLRFTYFSICLARILPILLH